MSGGAMRRALAAGLAALLAGLPALAQPPAPAAPPAAAPLPGGPLAIERQGSFFLGGRDVASDALSTLPAYAASGTITVDQVYVRYQVPAGGTGRPLVLVHGCCLTGKTWETTPDGRMGWDEYFLRRGHPVYVLDQAWRGRSAASPVGINRVRSGRAPTDELPTVFSAGHEPAWAIFRFGKEYPQVFPGMLFPLEAQAEFWKQMVPDWLNSLPTPNPTVPALSELAQRLDGAVLVSHSQSGIYPFQTAALNRAGIAGIVSIEPGACPSAKADMAPYRDLPILVLWGDYVDQSSRWALRLKGCRDFAAAAHAAGGKVENAVLSELGIKGNSHMLMQDRNSLEVADWLEAWLTRAVGPRP
ncbi:esterase [Roseicella sp. DB1501]|uniref:esterase n=1 Tax=Roseicella sp. DB1501 TaxID=2730925 RepID=UPI0014921BE8|nr:esterase [Roseicella sp. DB1501]NOG73213.1 esterase [Roseicella sp. DB1501]